MHPDADKAKSVFMNAVEMAEDGPELNFRGGREPLPAAIVD